MLNVLTYSYTCVNMKLASHEASFTEKGVGVSSRTIISIEKGQYSPSLMLAYRMARVFGVSVEELCCLEENLEMEGGL